MSCDKYRDRLNEYLDGRGELPEEHLAVCPECVRALDELRQVRAMVGSLRSQAPENLRQSVMSVAYERARRKPTIWQTVRASWWSRTGLAAAAVAAVALVSLHLTQPNGPAVPRLGPQALAEMADMHTSVQLAYVLPTDSPAPKGDVSKPVKDEYEDLYQTDGM